VLGLWRSAGSLVAGMRQWDRSSSKAPYFCSRAAQEVSMDTTAKNAKLAKIGGLIL
jgi:hypothetical protein